MNCKNCQSKIREEDKFCPQCGQSTRDELTLGELFRNTISNYLSVDARLFKSVLPLLFRPGYLPRKFIEGRRSTYLHPAQLYLFFSVIFFALLSLGSSDQAERTNEALERELSNTSVMETQFANDSSKIDSLTLDSTINVQPMTGSKTLSTELSFFDFDEKLVDSLHKNGASFEEILKELDIQQESFLMKHIMSQALRLYLTKGAGFMSVFYSVITFVLFISIPIFALFLKLLYYKGRPYTHHLVFAFDFFAVLFIGFIGHIVIVKTITLPDSWLGVLYLLIVLHLFLSLKFFYRQKWLKTILKSVVLLLMFSIFLIPLSLILTGAFAFLVY